MMCEGRDKKKYIVFLIFVSVLVLGINLYFYLERKHCVELFFHILAEDECSKAMTMLSKNPRLIEARLEDNFSPLMYAGSDEMTEILLHYGDCVDATDKFGRTPLHHMAMKGMPHAMELLISRGAIVDSKDFKGTTPLDVAAYYGHIDAAKVLLSNGANINEKNKDGETPLKMAIRQKESVMVEFLRKSGGKV